MIGLKPDTESKRYQRHPDLEWQVIEGRAVILDRMEGEILHLNEFGTRIWLELEGKKMPGEIVRELEKEYEIVPSRLRKDVAVFLKKLLNMELIQESQGNP